MTRLLAVAVLLGGCYTVRAGVGLAADTNGAVAPQLTVAVGLSTRDGGMTALGRVGLTDTTTKTQAVAWHRHHMTPDSREDVPDTMLRFDVRLGSHAKWVDDADAGFLFGGGAAHLWVIKGKDGCVFHGVGDQARHAVGVEVALDGVMGGDRTLPRGIASVGAVYQIDWYLHSSDCGS